MSRALRVALLVATAAHGALALAASRNRTEVAAPPPLLIDLIELAPSPAAVATTKREPPAPQALPAAPPPARAALPQPAATRPVTAPPAREDHTAYAAAVLDAASNVVDFGDAFVKGAATRYAGGLTNSSGRAAASVHQASTRGSVADAGPPAVDHSRPPQLGGTRTWQCPFPYEADDAGIDHAVVTLRVKVGADGALRGVSTLMDPGSGFGREARHCAASKRWLAGLDHLGQPVTAEVTLNVRFDR